MDFSARWNDSDKILLVENQPMHVHKSLLSLWSPVFARMFQGDFKEKDCEVITLKGKEYEQFKLALEIMYDRKFKVTESSLEYLLSLADEFQMDQLRGECIEFMRQSTVTNTLPYLELISRYNLHELKAQYIKETGRIDSEKLDDCEHYQLLPCDIKYAIASARVKYLEQLLDAYKNNAQAISSHLYSSMERGFENFVRKYHIENTVPSECLEKDSHKIAEKWRKFDINCTLCRKRVSTSIKDCKVIPNDISDSLEAMFKLTLK